MSFHKNGTWDLVKLPKEKKIVHCKWVFKRKEGIPRIEETRYKARLLPRVTVRFQVLISQMCSL